MEQNLSPVKKGGDKVIWWITFFMLLWSALAVLSTSAMREVESVTTIVLKYFFEVLLAVAAMWVAYKINYRYYKALSWGGILISVVLLILALATGKTIGGQNAARWVSIGPVNFQPSAFAIIAVVLFTARYLDKYNRRGREMLSPMNLLFQLWGWVLLIFAMIAYANLSTALILLSAFYVMLFVGRYPLRHILISWVFFILAGVMVVLGAKAFPEQFKGTRVATWTARVERYVGLGEKEDKKKSEDEARQLNESMTAIAFGGTSPKGPGKSVQKYFLPQADNDFLFAILVEEYSIVGGFVIVFLYFLFIVRGFIQMNKTKDYFGKFLIAGLVFVICFQAIVHMGVTVGLFPVTGQNLPFISSGGTSVIASCIAVGLIQSVVRRTREQEDALSQPLGVPTGKREETESPAVEKDTKDRSITIEETIENEKSNR